MAENPEVLVRNPRLADHPFFGQSRDPLRMLEVPRKGGGVARYVMPTELAQLVRSFDGRPTDEVVRAFCAAGRNRNPDRVARLIQDQLIGRRLIVPVGMKEDEMLAAHRPVGYFRIRVPLLGERIVRPVARALVPLFHPPVATALLLGVLLGHLALYRLGWSFGAAPHALAGRTWLAAAGLATLGALVHEFGHAAASVRFGCGRVRIGWGIYVYMAVFYTDLSETWRLAQRQRAVVDMGGVYLQAIFATLLGLGALLSGSAACRYAALAADVAIAGSLNPFLRMDGFWLLTDLVGVTSLRESVTRLVAALPAILRGRPLPSAVGLTKGAAVAVSVYGVVAMAFFGYLLNVLLSRVAMDLALHYFEAWRAVLGAVSAHAFGHAAAQALRAILYTLVLLGLAQFLLGVARTLREAGRLVSDAVRNRSGDARVPREATLDPIPQGEG